MFKSTLLFLILIISLSSQSREDIFHEVEKKDKNVIQSIYPDLMLNVGTGYLFHENNKFIGSSYKDNFSIHMDLKKYFFKGSYLNLSLTLSDTDYERYINNAVLDTAFLVSKNYLYLSYYLGIDYYFNSSDFKSPWFFGFGFGSNNFISNSGNINRFSVQLRFGKITDIQFLGGNMAFDVSALMFEDRGLQYINDPVLGAYAYTDWILFTSLKLSLSLSYDISKLIK